MRPLKRRKGVHLRHDPAPSRIAYRLNRIWLSPRLRRLITQILPVCLVVGALAAYFTQSAQQQMIRDKLAQIGASIEARPEFQIRQMTVTGASPVLANAIRERVEVDFPVSWFRIDPAAIQEKIAALDAVAKVQVTVELGGALHLAVTERDPAVIWRDADSLEMLDRTGHRIAFIDHRDGRADLPLITGEGADAVVPEALDLFAAASPLESRLRGLTRRGERRWDVILDRGQVIQLPEENPVLALERVLAMDKAKDLLARDIAVIDMRDPDRTTIRMGEYAMEQVRLSRAFDKKGSAKK